MTHLPPARCSLTAGSLFSGIGGLDLAASFAGFDIRFHVEIDDFCRKVLTKHAQPYWPNAKQHADVRAVGRHNLESVDVLFGGFPCQDVSVAGERAGLTEDTRTGLWFEFARIIGELRPAVVILENVPGIRSLGGCTVVGNLAAMGYDAIWFPLRAADAGAPHRRERWFCVAYAVRDGNGVSGAGQTDSHKERDNSAIKPKRHDEQHGVITYSKTLADITSEFVTRRQHSGGNRQRAHGSRGERLWVKPTRRSKAMADTNGRRQQQRHAAKRRLSIPDAGSEVNRTGQQGSTQSRMVRDAHGLSYRLDGHQFPAQPGQSQFDYEPERIITSAVDRVSRLKAIGNAVVPQCAFPVFLAVRAWLESIMGEEIAA